MLVTKYRFIPPLSTLVNSSFILKVNCYYLKIQLVQVDNNTHIVKVCELDRPKL